ncbi:hypothetical protein ABZ930_39630 [Streptomyces sp. NPDC046716]|uniref:hypothetical protein n=1 Tax=Streptomyces sp. NPDC046716 TaxID=3157093 RepID=UPI0033F5F948
MDRAVREPHASLGTPPERIPVTGPLTVERHTGGWPEAVGRARSVRIPSRGYAPGERRPRSADACPKWFGQHGGDRGDDGALVVLDAPGEPGGRSASGRGQ